MKLLVASNNPKKLAELEQVLAELGIEGVGLVSARDAGYTGEPKEDGLTFEDNALIKARAGAAATGLACVADDSGLAVDALRGMPGVLSARWSGAHGDDEANNRLLLAQMEDIELRSAAFVSCCALVAPGRGEWVGRVHGYAFALFLLASLNLGMKARWPVKTWILTAISGVVPFMSFVVESKRRKEVARTFQL